ncbi:MAG: methyltransferase domain-containing protein, partial [Gammaproteobacteria bacterium]
MPNLQDIVACPRCLTPLVEFVCRACDVEYPVLDGVPWLVADPACARLEWRNRWQMALADLEARQRAAREALASDRSAPTRERLEILAEGYARQHRALKTLLSSLGLARPADLGTYIALRTRLPTQLGLNSYEANVFRDWCWGDQENEAALRAIGQALDGAETGTVLVLGAGAGRLAYDVHRTRAPGLTIALELNPYLTTVLNVMAAGGSLALTEFPLAPISGQRSAIERTLAAPEPAGDGFEVVLADALHAPFIAGTFDVVITPWLLDVIDAPPGAVLAEVNRLLKPGSRWIYQGSLAFNRADVAENLNLAELLELAADHGFSEISAEDTAGPYLDCPDSRHARRELILTAAWQKSLDVATTAPHQNLPDWIVEGSAPV